MQPAADFQRHPRLLNRRAGLALAAVISGIYFGASTVSSIDPFYLHGPADEASSYTLNGWHGADAVPPPAVPVADRMSEFVSHAYGIPRPYDAPEDVAAPAPSGEDGVVYMGDTPPALTQDGGSGMSEVTPADGGYECVNCDEADAAGGSSVTAAGDDPRPAEEDDKGASAAP